MLQYDIWILKFLVYLIALWLIPRYSLRHFTIRIKMGSIVWSLSLMFYIVMRVIQNRLMEVYILDVRTLALLSLALFFHLASVLVVIWLIYVGYRDNLEKAQRYSMGLIVLRELGFFPEILYTIGILILGVAILKKNETK